MELNIVEVKVHKESDTTLVVLEDGTEFDFFYSDNSNLIEDAKSGIGFDMRYGYQPVEGDLKKHYDSLEWETVWKEGGQE